MNKNIRTLLVMAAVGAALLANARSASAWERWDRWRPIDRSGLYLGVAGMGNLILNQSSAPVNGFIDHGAGFGFQFGFRFHPMFAIEAAYALNFHNPVQTSTGWLVDALLLHAGTIDMKVFFPNHSNVRPYLEGGLGLYELAGYTSGSSYINGLGFQLGGGLDIWISPVVSVGARALYHGISFTQNIRLEKPFLSTLSLEGNLQVHF